MQELIDFCKEVGLQSSAAASRNATVKLIGVLHKFIGPGISYLDTCPKSVSLSIVSKA